MTLTGSRQNTGRWDSELSPLPCDRYNNAEMTIFLRVFLEQVNPAGGAAEGTAREWGTDAGGRSGTGRGTARRIVRWNTGTWNRWRRRYQREVQAFWHGKFWLVARHTIADLDFEERSVTYRPNIWCRFRLQVTDTAAAAHHTISVVRLHASEGSFRSDSAHYDHRDIQTNSYSHGGQTYRQRAHVHEVGHLLGMGHAAEADPTCTAGGNIGATACYCATAADCGNVMGSGEGRRPSNASPWQRAMEEHGGGTRINWEALLRRHYPRTLEEVGLRRQITARPARG